MPFSHTERLLVVLVPALAVGGWASLATAQWGRWSPAWAMVAAAAAGLAGAVAGFKSSPLSVRDFASWRDRPTSNKLALFEIGPVVAALLVLVRLWPAVTPWPIYLDASWYVNTAARIEREGSLTFHPQPLAIAPDARRPLLATFADHANAGVSRMPANEQLAFYDVAFAVADGAGGSTPEAWPYHPPFFAAFLALAGHWRDPNRLGDGVLPWTFAYLLAAAALAQALAAALSSSAESEETAKAEAQGATGSLDDRGPRWGRSRLRVVGTTSALVAVIFLGVGPGLAYYGRQPFAEVAAGACLVTALWAGVRAARSPGPAPAWIVLYGLGLGLAALLKIDAAPAAGVGLAWWALARYRLGGRRELAAVAAGMGLPIGHLLWLGTGVTRPYLELNGGGVWRIANEHAGEMALLVGALLAIGVLGLARRRQRRARSARTDPKVRTAGAARGSAPALAAQRSEDQPTTRFVVGRAMAAIFSIGLVAALVRAALRPADQAPGMADLLLWLASPLGVAGALAGLWWLTGQVPLARAASPVLAQALISLPLVLTAPLVSESLSSLYTARRLVPLALPLVAVGAAVAVAWLARPGRSKPAVSRTTITDARDPRRDDAWRRLAAVAGLALALFALYRAGAPLAGLREFDGGRQLTERLSAYGDSDDVWLFSSPLAGAAVGRFAAPMWSLAGREAAALGPDAVAPDALARTARALSKPGARVFLVTDEEHVPEGLPDGSLRYLGEESIVTAVVLPSPGLPPRVGPLPIKALVFALDFGG